MAMKHTLTAGVAALALLVTPVGLTAQWSDHGPAISTTPVISTAHAAPNRPTTTKPPATGGPTFTSSGNVSKTRGFHPSLFIDKMNEYCQGMADAYDGVMDLAGYHQDANNGPKALEMYNRADEIKQTAESRGCVFVPA